jgi:membrane-associated phospholipid phosphatase
MGMAMVVWLDYLIETEWYLVEKKKILEFCFAFTFGCTVAYSRMFLGVHSLD